MNSYIFRICLLISLLITKIKTQDDEPLLHVSEDTLSFKFLIRNNFEFYLGITNRFDFSSMSSNFSTNIPNLFLPGVRGRNGRETNTYFEEYEFKPLSVSSKDGQLMILEQSRNKVYNIRGESNGGLKMIDTVLNEVFQTHPEIECSNQSVYKVYWALICFNVLQRKDFKMDVLYDYTLILIDSSNNSVEFIGKFKDYYYKNSDYF